MRRRHSAGAEATAPLTHAGPVIYLNQAGTSWPKPPAVSEAVAHVLAAPPDTWPGRLEALQTEVSRALGVERPDRLLFTPGATSALAIAVEHLPWERGDRVICSGLEHSALEGPLRALAARGVERIALPRGAREPMALDVLKAELGRGGVRLLAMTAACNVTGELLPYEAAMALAREYDALSLIDAAQVTGWLSSAGWAGADLWAFAGHKGPHGPWGIGGLYVALHVRMEAPGARCRGSTGTPAMPGYCEAGSVNLPALAGLAAGLRWVRASGQSGRLAGARERMARIAAFLEGHSAVTIHGTSDPDTRLPTLAASFRDRRPEEVARELGARGFVASAGQQCAPLAHETLGTLPDGVLRLSIGPLVGDGDVSACLDALTEVLGSP